MTIYFLITVNKNEFKLVNLFLVSANFTGIYKAYKLMKNREAIRSFIKFYFDRNWTNSLDSTENLIHKKNNSTIKFVHKIFYCNKISEKKNFYTTNI